MQNRKSCIQNLNDSDAPFGIQSLPLLFDWYCYIHEIGGFDNFVILILTQYSIYQWTNVLNVYGVISFFEDLLKKEYYFINPQREMRSLYCCSWWIRDYFCFIYCWVALSIYKVNVENILYLSDSLNQQLNLSRTDFFLFFNFWFKTQFGDE